MDLHEKSLEIEITKVEKTNYLRFLFRNGEKVTSGSRVEVGFWVTEYVLLTWTIPTQ